MDDDNDDEKKWLQDGTSREASPGAMSGLSLGGIGTLRHTSGLDMLLQVSLSQFVTSLHLTIPVSDSSKDKKARIQPLSARKCRVQVNHSRTVYHSSASAD